MRIKVRKKTESQGYQVLVQFDVRACELCGSPLMYPWPESLQDPLLREAFKVYGLRERWKYLRCVACQVEHFEREEADELMTCWVRTKDLAEGAGRVKKEWMDYTLLQRRAEEL